MTGQSSSAEPRRVVVLGIGNTLNRDEGVGVHALQALEAYLTPQPPLLSADRRGGDRARGEVSPSGDNGQEKGSGSELDSPSPAGGQERGLGGEVDSPSPAGGQERGLGGEVRFLDGGTLGLNLLSVVEEASHLLILDAVDARQPAGTVVELAGKAIPLFTGVKLSQHQVTFQEVLGLAAFRGHLPAHLHLIGVQPEDLEIGLELSAVVEAVVPEVVRRACAVLESWDLSIQSEQSIQQ